MKMLNKRIVFSALIFVLMGMSQVVLAEQRTLTGDEVTAMFSDKTVWGEHAIKDKQTVGYFAADGSFTGRNLANKNTKSTGKWSVDKKGRLCLKKGGEKKKCTTVVDDGGEIFV
ncbi:unnamed protein product [marine sediment metagenome]|uniref:DUF995 domain-containing protein n=1 Tax=marine sediment metagenome TaxID=412755 RepID=X1AAQ1_9ZZZZ